MHLGLKHYGDICSVHRNETEAITHKGCHGNNIVKSHLDNVTTKMFNLV